jgi:hypothetical protein
MGNHRPRPKAQGGAKSGGENSAASHSGGGHAHGAPSNGAKRPFKPNRPKSAKNAR